MAQTKEQKRHAAVERAKKYKWEDSKACRTKSCTKEVWEFNRQKLIDALS